MGRHFANYLTGLLMMMVFVGMTSAHILPYVDDNEDLETDVLLKEIQNNDITPPNRIDLNTLTKKTSVKRKMREYTDVKLQGSGDVTQIARGGSHTLSCVMNSNSGAEVHLVHGEKALLEVLNRAEKKAASLWFQGSMKKSIARINMKYLINCADEADEGPYYCVATTGNKILIQSTRVMLINNKNEEEELCDMESDRVPVITSHVDSIFSPIGSRVTLRCRADGNPQPEIIWYRSDEKKINGDDSQKHYEVHSNGDLVIDSLNWKADRTDFICVAKSSAGIDTASTFMYPYALE